MTDRQACWYAKSTLPSAPWLVTLWIVLQLLKTFPSTHPWRQPTGGCVLSSIHFPSLQVHFGPGYTKDTCCYSCKYHFQSPWQLLRHYIFTHILYLFIVYLPHQNVSSQRKGSFSLYCLSACLIVFMLLYPQCLGHFLAISRNKYEIFYFCRINTCFIKRIGLDLVTYCVSPSWHKSKHPPVWCQVWKCPVCTWSDSEESY